METIRPWCPTFFIVESVLMGTNVTAAVCLHWARITFHRLNNELCIKEAMFFWTQVMYIKSQSFFKLFFRTFCAPRSQSLEDSILNKQQPVVCVVPSSLKHPSYPCEQGISCQLRRLLLAPTACTWQTSTVAPSFFSSLSQIICLGDRRSLGPFTSTSYKEMID